MKKINFAILIPVLAIFLLILACGSSNPESVEEINNTNTPTESKTFTSTVELLEPSPTITPTLSPIGNVTVTVNLANLRSGPGTTFEVVGSSSFNDILPIYGKDESSEWIITDWKEGVWISTTIVELDVDINSIPIFENESNESTSEDDIIENTQNENSFSPTPTQMSSLTPQITSTTTSLVNVPSLLGKTVAEVESIIGKTILITPNDDNDDSTPGGEYRDYNIGDYLIFISYDKNGISRIFTVLDGLESDNYSLQDWKILLPQFGILTNSEPDNKAQTLYSWDNQNGVYIGIASFSTKGYPVWTVKIAQKGYEKIIRK